MDQNDQKKAQSQGTCMCDLSGTFHSTMHIIKAFGGKG